MAQEIIIQVSCHDFFTWIVRNITDFLYITNLRIVEFFFITRIITVTTDVFLYHELSNYRIHDKIYKSVMLRGTPCEDNSIIR